MITAEEIIKLLDLLPLSKEGGFFRETYKGKDKIDCSHILSPKQQLKQRATGTAIYYLVTPTSFSTLHRVPSDETFHFYLGNPIRLVMLNESLRSVEEIVLGNNLLAGEVPQYTVEGGRWQGLRLVHPSGFALLGTTVAPGFEFEDLEIADPLLLNEFPDLSDSLLPYMTHLS